MFKFKLEKLKDVEKFNLAELARIVGISYNAMFLTIKKSRPTTKVTAFSITKALNSEAEIDDYFERV